MQKRLFEPAGAFLGSFVSVVRPSNGCTQESLNPEQPKRQTPKPWTEVGCRCPQDEDRPCVL